MDGALQEQTVTCPYCWESISVLLDPGDSGGSYVEDCQVCCRPINIKVSQSNNGDLNVFVSNDEESFDQMF